MWSDFSGKAYNKEHFTDRVNSLKWTDWKPIGIVLHNTSAPTLAQWAESGEKHDARIRNLQSYYEGMGWHGGPHWFISRDWFNEFSNPLRRGTHSPGFNAQYLGIEMVGEYDREEFNSGDGAKVRDNAVYAMAVLCNKFGWIPSHVIKFHKEDPRTTHKDCPGKKVVKSDIIDRVDAELAKMTVLPEKPAPYVVTNVLASVFGYPGDEGRARTTSAYGGFVDPNKPECALPFRFKGAPPKVRVTNTARGLSVMCDVRDVGPWTSKVGMDPYWETVNGRPKSERAPGTNKAGIDLTPAAARSIGIDGLGRVDVELFS